MAPTLLDRSVRCTYRSTYHRRSRQFGGDSTPVMGHPCSAEGTPKCPRSVVDSYTRRAVKYQHEAVRSLLCGAFAPTFRERACSSVSTTNLQTTGLNKLLYSVSEAAQLLSCSRNTVYALMRSGELLAVYPTSKARIPAIALVRFVELKEIEARSEQMALKRRFR